MNIFFIDVVKPPATNPDGSFVHKWELVENLLLLGNKIHVLSESHYDSLNNLIFHITPKIKIFKRLRYAVFLLKVIKSNKFDVLYVRMPGNLLGIIGYLGKKLTGVPLIFEINGIDFQEQELVRYHIPDEINILEKILLKFKKYKEIFMWKRADAIITVTEGIRDFLVRYGVKKNRIWVIENGANTRLFRPMNQKKVRDELGLKRSERYICFVGNLAPWQGLEYLVQAAPLVLDRVKVKFLIVGDGIMREQLEKMVEEQGLVNEFIFTGGVPYEKVPKYINASDLCVAPFAKPRNKEIGLSPLKIYEYMACGKPIVASRIPNLEFVEEQNAGILVEPENPSELAKAIIKVLRDKNLQNLCIKSRGHTVKYHSWKHIAQKVERVCKDVILAHKT